MKKMLKGLLGFFILFSVSNVHAKLMYFIEDCPSSKEIADKYDIDISDGSGWYDVPYVGDQIEGGGDSGVCTAPALNNMACDFGCLDSALSGQDAIKNNSSVIEDLNGGAPIAGNAYCKMVCIPKNEFEYPGFIPTVEQGTKFTWTIGGSSGVLDNTLEPEILKLNVTTECAVVFDTYSWKEAYNSAVATINSYNNMQKSKYASRNTTYTCPAGYTKKNDKCERYSSDHYPIWEPVDVIDATARTTYSCDSNYDLSGQMCYLKPSFKNAAIAAASQINSLRTQALACSSYNSTPNVSACGDAYLEYDDEKYGGSDYRIKLDEEKGGTSNTSGWSSKTTYLSMNTYDCSGTSCVATNSSISNFNYYKTARFTSSASWSLPSYFYRYVLINGVSIFNHNESQDFANAGGLNNYYGRYQNYIDIGFPNFPVNFNSSVGEHKISIDFQFCDAAGVYAGEAASGSCPYNVTNCEDGQCPPSVDDGDDDQSATGVDVVYRVIDLNNPFPGLNGEKRLPGLNWSIDSTYVDRFITNNRGVLTEEVYNKEPMYTILLTPSLINEIRAYNKEHMLNDFEMVCSDGFKCRSIYLRNLIENGHVSGCGTNDDFDACFEEDGR